MTARHHSNAGAKQTLLVAAGALLLAIILLAPQPAQASPCEDSARQAFKACNFDTKDDFWETKAICTHLSNAGEQSKCLAQAARDRAENKGECRDIFEFRMEFCEATGERHYDPPFQRSMFTNAFDDSNPYWPLTVGNRWVLESEDETIVVQVLPAVKRIGGVNCVVVNDVVSEGGRLIEDTDDWYGLAKNGDVYYCGENAKDYEYFRGDKPREAELTAIDGSFKHGIDGAKAGVVMFGSPTVGQMYRQEFSLGDAEDGAEVLSTTYSWGDGSGLDRLVPRDLAKLFCNGDCLVTREFNLIEPGAEALKYYSPGVGVFLEVEDDEVVQLVACNVDPRCNEL